MCLSKTVRDTYPSAYRPDPDTGGATARIDDWGPSDVPTLCCQISVEVRRNDSFRLTLHNPPLSDEVRAVVGRCGGRVTEHPTTVIELDFPSPRSARAVRELAAAVRGVTARGRRYPNPNWKWVAPRTADSLLRFARLLTEAARRTTTRC